MTPSKRIALPLAVAIHILLFYALGKFVGHPIRPAVTGNPLVVRLISILPVQSERIKATPSLSQETASSRQPKRVAAMPLPLSVPVTVDTKIAEPPQPNVSGGLLAQSALNAVGEIDRDERRTTGRGANILSNSLAARMSAAIDKNTTVKAGTIDENVYPDGRREERIHTPFGVVCITYEAPSNPTDGFDTMQRGLQPSVPHTCGHRFD
ncbi:MAG TPA: hypothetical protein VK832_18170 [Burkholderiaceae bacterium]|jgi:hypothetical protein|nr:hypothetical protein [Burkholderiaceae bacterium]